MSRIRNIKPDYFKHEKIVDLPRDIRLFFIGLWSHCDCRGVFEWRPRYLKIEIFPCDEDIGAERIESFLAALEVAGCIRWFVDGDKRYGEVHDFLKHQAISGRELKAGPKYPPPPAREGQASAGTGQASAGTCLASSLTDQSSLTKDKGQRTSDEGRVTACVPSTPAETTLARALVLLFLSDSPRSQTQWTALAKLEAGETRPDRLIACIEWCVQEGREKGRTIRHAEDCLVDARDYQRRYAPRNGKASA